MNKAEYLATKEKLKSLGRKQYAKKQQYRDMVKAIASTRARLERNKVMSPEGHPGAEYIPARAVETLISQQKQLGKIQKDLAEGRTLILETQNDLVLAKAGRMMELALRKMVETKPTIRDVAQSIFKAQGLFLHDNNEVSGQGGKLVGRVDDILVKDGVLKIKYSPVEALDYIVVDIRL